MEKIYILSELLEGLDSDLIDIPNSKKLIKVALSDNGSFGVLYSPADRVCSIIPFENSDVFLSKQKSPLSSSKTKNVVLPSYFEYNSSDYLSSPYTYYTGDFLRDSNTPECLEDHLSSFDESNFLDDTLSPIMNKVYDGLSKDDDLSE